MRNLFSCMILNNHSQKGFVHEIFASVISYTSLAFSYLLFSLLTLKIPLKPPVISVMLLYITVLCPVCIVKIFHTTANTLLLHCFHLLIILFIFKEYTLKKRLKFVKDQLEFSKKLKKSVWNCASGIMILKIIFYRFPT